MNNAEFKNAFDYLVNEKNILYIFSKNELLDIKNKIEEIELKFKLHQIKKLDIKDNKIDSSDMSFIFKYDFINLECRVYLILCNI